MPITRRRPPSRTPAYPLTTVTVLLAMALVAPSVAVAEWVEPKGEDPPPTWLYTRQLLAFGLGPSVAYVDSRAELRAPLARSSSIVLQDTFVAAGARVAATPAFVHAGPRFTLAPLDIFDVTVQASVERYFGTSNGMFGVDAIGPTTSSWRSENAKDTEGATQLTLDVMPTLKLRVGPVIAASALTLTWTRASDDAGQGRPLLFDAFRDLTLARRERITIVESVALIDTTGDRRWLLWVGAMLRHARAANSGDRSTALGPMIVVRPTANTRLPRYIVQTLWYLDDFDYQGATPGVRLAAVWEGSFR